MSEKVIYLYIKHLRYERQENLVRQLESQTKEESKCMDFSKCDLGRIFHLSNSNAALAKIDKSLCDVS